MQAKFASLLEECYYVVYQQGYFIEREVINTTGKIKGDFDFLGPIQSKS